MNELETSIVDISDDVLDNLFDETPDKTVNADALLGGKKTEKVEDEDEEEQEVSEKKSKKLKTQPKAVIQPYTNAIEDVDLNDLEDKDETEDETEESDDKGKKAVKVVEETAKKANAEKVLESQPEVAPILKSTVDYLIQTGIWEDFEGREELDVTEEVYAKLVQAQDTARVESLFSEMVDSTGPFGKAIIDFVKTGGNPDDIIDLFKEQKSIEAIGIDDAEGQKEMVKHYYSEILGWKPESIEKHLSRLLLSNELEDHAKEVKEMFTQHYKKEADRLNATRKEEDDRQRAAEVAFEGNIKNTVKERKDLTPSEKKTVEDYLLSYDQKLPNGKLVNKFYVNFAKMQANPADYVDLVLFVMNKEKFINKVATTEKSKAAAEAFKFIKGNGAVSTKKGSTYDQHKKNEKVSTFDWGIPNK